ncbi:MAG: hypothetical protein JXR71_08105 [Bacteroidales bacterium]|nr:hypothetical protein [Bacteroidales bacterium]
MVSGILIPQQSPAQEMAALGFSNYSGISGIRINPAFLTGSKVYLDVNILGGHVFFDNNFAYIPNDSVNFWSFLRKDTLPTPYGGYGFNDLYTYYSGRKYNNLAAVASVMAPSAMLQVGKHAFGISFSARNYESTYRASNNLLQLLYNGISDATTVGETGTFKNLNFVSLSWMELGLHYAYDFYNRYGEKLTAGASLKLLYGVEGFYSSINELKYQKLDSIHYQIDTLNGSVGFSLPIDYNNSSAYLNPLTKGHGIGLDLGIVYTRNRSNVAPKDEKSLCGKPYEDYLYRIGFSIMDIGRIRFKNHAQLHEYQVGNVVLNSDNLIQNPSGMNGIMQNVSSLLYNGDSLASLKDSVFSMSLPTAMSLQMDYHFKKNIYISGLWIQPLRFQNKSLRRPAQLLVMPRYDTREFGVSLPISWYDYQKLRLGLALRFYTVTIGTEKLGTFLGVGDLTGMDLYFNIKINLQKGTCLSWKNGACFSAGK